MNPALTCVANLETKLSPAVLDLVSGQWRELGFNVFALGLKKILANNAHDADYQLGTVPHHPLPGHRQLSFRDLEGLSHGVRTHAHPDASSTHRSRHPAAAPMSAMVVRHFRGDVCVCVCAWSHEGLTSPPN